MLICLAKASKLTELNDASDISEAKCSELSLKWASYV
jgi:hypothetical protein